MSNNVQTKTKLALRYLLSLALSGAITGSVQAAVKIPKEGGFSGHINIGVGGIDVETNMIASIGSDQIDISKPRLNNLIDSPESETSGLPTINFELAYTFEETGTQLYIGNVQQDFIRFDMNTVAGVRQDMGFAGILDVRVTNTSLVTEVWEDPYLTGVNRKSTDRTSTGGGIVWQQIFGTGLELRASGAEVDLDEERSGAALGLTSALRDLLDRNGDVYRAEILYEITSDNKRHTLVPGLTYLEYDLDGEAVASDGSGLKVEYIYSPNDHWRFVLKGSYLDLQADEINPIYGEDDSFDRWGARATAIYNEPFGWKKWAANATAGWFDEDHDIDFYDSTVTVVTVGMYRKF